MKRALVFIILSVVLNFIIHGSILVITGITMSVFWSIIIGFLEYPFIDYFTDIIIER